ncbi:MAG: response regulator transcription factor, partial [Alphaproteobacteria bacterium]|nr:response regulator transcription factor [Alphaproteobacteria bacterium]
MKILVADDHELFRNGISMSLSALDDDIEIVAACDYEELIAVIEKTPDMDLILTDLAMPGMPWADALRIIRGKLPDVPVVILSAVHDKQIVQKAVKMGVSGFIPKTSTSKVIISALHLILAGGIYLPPEILVLSDEEDM